MLRRTILVVFASAAALAVAVSAGGAPTRAAASPFIGTWKILPAAGTPWANGGTLTIRASTRAEVAGYAIAPPVGRFSQMHGRCLGFDPPSPAEPDYVPPAVTGWFVATASWDSQTMGGCYSDKTVGRVTLWTQDEAAGGEAFFTSDQKLMGRWKGASFEAKPGEQGTTKTVSEPAPGKSAFVDSPNLPVDCGSGPDRSTSAAKSCKRSIDVSSTGGDLEGTLFGEIGSVERHAASLLIVCWLTEFTDDNGKVVSPSPATKLRFCLAFMKYFLGKNSVRHDRFFGATGNFGYRPDVPGGRGATAGCRTQRMTLALRLRKGKVVSSKRVKNKPLKASSVRYTCTASGNTAKINLTGPANLRKAIGKKLAVGVYRSPKAPRQSGKLRFTFGW